MTLTEKIDEYREEFELHRIRRDKDGMLWLAAKLLRESAEDDRFLGEADTLIAAVTAYLEV